MFRTYSGQQVLQKCKSSIYTGLCRQMTQASVNGGKYCSNPQPSLKLQAVSSSETLITISFIHSFIHSFTHSLISPSVLRQVHSLSQSEFSTGCDLVLPLSVPSIPNFPSGHPVAAYFFFHVFPTSFTKM